MKIFDIAIIGGGSAGTMALQRSILNNDECLFFPGTPKDKKKARAFWVTKVENMPAHFQYKKGIEEPGVEVVNWLLKSPFKDKLHYKKNIGIKKISKLNDETFELIDSKDEVYYSKFIILCTGVMDVQPIIQGSIEPIFPYANIQLADYCLRCDGHHVLHKKISVIGSNSSALWVAIMLYERYQCPEVSILGNGENVSFDDETLAIAKKYNFNIYQEAIVEILGDAPKKVLTGFKLSNEKIIESEFCFIALGMIVYNELAKQVNADLDARGFVMTDNKGKSSVNGLYIAGDLRANTKKQIYTAWDTAVDSADEINAILRRSKRNQPKI
jgi:thioredoxin reductase (NADPH)